MSELWKIGDLIENKYEIHDIKKGGKGIVFLCYDYENETPVAIKTFQDKYLTDQREIERFIQEAEIWVRLEKHKNIVQAYMFKMIHGRPYIFLEYVAGDSYYGSDLKGWIYKGGLDIKTIVDLGIQICRGMEYAEKKFKEWGLNFVHRDIKPSNIMITQDKVVKITDFGLVKVIAGEDKEIRGRKEELSEMYIRELTGCGKILGTPGYMSPEQCMGEEVDIRSDIYSFGCVLYEMVCRRPVFTVSDDIEPDMQIYLLISKHIKEEPIEPIKIIGECPKLLNEVIMKCLEKKREEISKFQRIKRKARKYILPNDRRKDKRRERERIGSLGISK